ncbi:MAG: hypothetical protein C4586_08745 [Anaerolineaceae bacterium]|nr:MAG: hypothetical protein C4586_08745 [Anaerolineaceae bacterium]
MLIKPTVGRVVWYWPAGAKVEQPFAATVAYVHSDHMVNLSVIDANGHQFPAMSIPLVQDNEETPGLPYCCWMPYQKGQAAKTEVLEKKLSGEGVPDHPSEK